MIVELYVAACALALAGLLWWRKGFLLTYLGLGGLFCAGVVWLGVDATGVGLMALSFLMALVGPAIRLMWIDLRDIARKLGRGHLFRLAARSLLLWLPIGLLALGSVLLIQWRNEKVVTEVYDLPEVPWSAWNGACQKILCKGDGPDLRRDMHASVDRIGAALQSQVERRLDARLSSIDMQSDNLRNELTRTLFHHDEGMLPDTFTKFSGIQVPGCNWMLAVVWPPEVKDCLQRSILKPIADTYASARSELQTEVNTALNAGQGKIEGGTDAVRTLILGGLNERVQTATSRINQGIDALFLAGLVLSILSWISLSMVTLKSYLTILARHVFDTKSGGMFLTVGAPQQGDAALAGQDITRTDGANGYKIPLGDQLWYGSFGHIVRPIEFGRPTYPRLGQLLFQRLFAAKMRMQRFDPQSFDTIGGQADFSFRFVRVDLPEGRKLYFNVKNLAAFSQGVRFRSVFSLKLAAILQYRLFFSVVEGPGSVILRVDGGTMRLMPPDEAEGADPMDLAAFDWGGQFALRAQHDFLSVYSEGYTIVPEDRTFVIRHAPQRLVRRGGKLLRKTLFFLLPI